jgi:hypothetical protein
MRRSCSTSIGGFSRELRLGQPGRYPDAACRHTPRFRAPEEDLRRPLHERFNGDRTVANGSIVPGIKNRGSTLHAEAGASSGSARTTASRLQRASQAPRRIRSHPYVYGTLDQEEWAEYSDHAPIISTFEADSPGSEG